MMECLVESEVLRLTAAALAAPSRQAALEILSISISQDLVSITDHPTWLLVHQSIAKIFGADSAACGLILRWLIGQIASPITQEESLAQSKRLATSLFN
ncbi:MAG: hypothetical protein GM47_1625 [actinobacterium acIB-AMD-6]|nr:MAG: hypothetical protein GM47_1625 [actinobacterium acIB-AMD-6]